MTPNARSVLARTASTGRYGPLWSDRGEIARTSTRHVLPGSKVSPAWKTRPHGRTSAATGVGQCVDRDIGGYSPSLRPSLAASAPLHTVTAVSPARRAGPTSRGSTDRSGAG